MSRPSLRGVLLPAPPLDDLEPVDARVVLRALASLRPGRSWLTRAENLYVAVFTVAVIIGLTWTFARRAGSLVTDIAAFYHFIWGTPLILLLFIGILRYSTVQGFVSFNEADCYHVLPAPLRRRDLVRPRLLAATVLLGVVGALVGVLAVLTASGSHAGARVGEAALAGLALGVLLVASSWHVQRLRWATAWVMRLTIPLLGGAVLLAFAQTGGHTVRMVGLWSGPWGWGLLPLTSGAPSWSVVGLGLLCALALAGVVSMWMSAGWWNIQSFRVRARTRSQVVASLYAFDYRSIGQAARGDKSQNWQARIRLRPPKRPVFIVPWHGALALLRSPVRLGWSVVLAGAGMYLLALQPLRQGALWAGSVAFYLAASSLLEPLRQEVDTPGTAKILLPWQFERVQWLHCLLPAGIMIAAGVLTLAGGLATGFLTAHAVAQLLILAVPLSCFVVFAAALSGRKGGRVSNNLVNLAAMDTTGFSWISVIIQLAIWAILALAGTALGVWLLSRDGFAFKPVLAAVFFALAAVAGGMQVALRTKPGPSLMERMAEAQKAQ
jgi:hypothetical protein